jgi:hypothetical protein
MKNSFALFVIVSGVLFTSMHAATKAGYQPATVVSVETRAIPSDYAGADPRNLACRVRQFHIQGRRILS